MLNRCKELGGSKVLQVPASCSFCIFSTETNLKKQLFRSFGPEVDDGFLWWQHQFKQPPSDTVCELPALRWPLGGAGTPVWVAVRSGSSSGLARKSLAFILKPDPSGEFLPAPSPPWAAGRPACASLELYWVLYVYGAFERLLIGEFLSSGDEAEFQRRKKSRVFVGIIWLETTFFRRGLRKCRCLRIFYFFPNRKLKECGFSPHLFRRLCKRCCICTQLLLQRFLN